MRATCAPEEADAKVTRLVTRCVLESSSEGDSPSKISAQLKAHCRLLQLYVSGKSEGDFTRQTHCLFEVQHFCYEREFPTGLIKKLFYQVRLRAEVGGRLLPTPHHMRFQRVWCSAGHVFRAIIPFQGDSTLKS